MKIRIIKREYEHVFKKARFIAIFLIIGYSLHGMPHETSTSPHDSNKPNFTSSQKSASNNFYARFTQNLQEKLNSQPSTAVNNASKSTQQNLQNKLLDFGTKLLDTASTGFKKIYHTPGAFAKTISSDPNYHGKFITGDTGSLLSAGKSIWQTSGKTLDLNEKAAQITAQNNASIDLPITHAPDNASINLPITHAPENASSAENKDKKDTQRAKIKEPLEANKLARQQEAIKNNQINAKFAEEELAREQKAQADKLQADQKEAAKKAQQQQDDALMAKVDAERQEKLQQAVENKPYIQRIWTENANRVGLEDISIDLQDTNYFPTLIKAADGSSTKLTKQDVGYYEGTLHGITIKIGMQNPSTGPTIVQRYPETVTQLINGEQKPTGLKTRIIESGGDKITDIYQDRTVITTNRYNEDGLPAKTIKHPNGSIELFDANGTLIKS